MNRKGLWVLLYKTSTHRELRECAFAKKTSGPPYPDLFHGGFHFDHAELTRHCVPSFKHEVELTAQEFWVFTKDSHPIHEAIKVR
jgi:hypothetical protein